MASLNELDEGQLGVLAKVEKLMRLAGNNPNQEEAAKAAAKAQELLEAYNLEAYAESAADGDGARSQERLEGGFYKHDQELWSWVAEINFCLYWHSWDYVERSERDRSRRKVQERYSGWAQKYRKQHRHHLVGRRINVQATERMVGYLRQAIERSTKEFLLGRALAPDETRVVGLGASLRSKRAVSFRRGVVDAVTTRLWRMREDREAEERARAREAEMAANKAAAAGASSSTAITLSTVRQSERDANMDVLYGEGWSANQRAAQARRAAAEREAEEEYTRWAAENPEEAAKEAEKRRKEERKRSQRRRGGGRGSRGGRVDTEDSAAWSAGLRVGEKLGLDPQTSQTSAPLKIAARA